MSHERAIVEWFITCSVVRESTFLLPVERGLRKIYRERENL
jgi:hypothetical protein